MANQHQTDQGHKYDGLGVYFVDVSQKIFRDEFELQNDAQRSNKTHGEQSPFGQGGRLTPGECPVNDGNSHEHGVKIAVERHEVFLLEAVEFGHGVL